MEIVLTNHAKIRMKQRKITLEMVTECVESPDYVYAQQDRSVLSRKRILEIPGIDFIIAISRREGNKIVIITSYIV